LDFFFFRFGFHFAAMFKVKPKLGDFTENIHYCIYGSEAAAVELTGALSLDLIIDFYVTFRLMQILAKANKNASQISSNIIRKTKRTLFTAVMYWNFVRSTLAICDSAINLYSVVLGYQNKISIDLQMTMHTLSAAFAIFLSLAITSDAEIVRVIEGKKKKNIKVSSGNSGGNEKSTKNSEKDKEKDKSIPQSSRSTLVSSSQYQTSSDPPKYSAGNYSDLNEKQEFDDVSDDKITIVSVKKQSSFE